AKVLAYAGGLLAVLDTPENEEDTFTVLQVGLEAGNACSPRFFRYTGAGSKPNGRWLVSGSEGPPYGTNFGAGEEALQIPPQSRPLNNVEEVEVPWYEPVAGPRPVTLNPQWGKGGGTEYYRGSLRFPD